MRALGALDLDATAQLAQLASGRVSAVELLKASLAQHERTHGALNAVVAVDLERALERARAMDELRSRGEAPGPLAGLPMTVKDTLDVAGMPASSGLAALRRRQSEDAVCVSHVRRAGAVIWGKTNVPVMAADWQTSNGLYGVTRNPWDIERTCGGSSGGAAAAVAAQVTPLEIGSDIGGSLRVPASFCGVFSHKPTWGLVTQHGHVPPSPGSWSERDLNVIGPMARSARDLRLLLSVMAVTPIAQTAPPADLSQMRIGLWLDDPLLPLDAESRAVLEGLASRLEAAGATIEPIASPVAMGELLGAYVLLLGSVLGADMPARARRRARLAKPFLRLDQARGAGPFASSAMALASVESHARWLEADAVRARLAHEMSVFFQSYNVILAPAAPTAAFPHDHRAFSRRRLNLGSAGRAPYSAMMGWIALASACRLPATVVPAGLTAHGLPVGAQLIGAHGADARTLDLAQAIDEQIQPFEPPPPVWISKGSQGNALAPKSPRQAG